MQVSLSLVNKYLGAEKKNNYVFSNNLRRAIATTNLESVHYKHLPNGEKCLFLFIPDLKDPDGDLAENIFIWYDKGETDFIIKFCWFTANNATGHGNYLFTDNGSNLQEQFVEDNNQTLDPSDISYVEFTKENESSYGVFFKLVLNSLIYIENNREQFVEERNEFKGSKKAISRQQNIYSNEPFNYADLDAEMVRLMKVTEGSVRGHFRWQPCGVERANVKLIFVKPHVRNYTKL